MGLFDFFKDEKKVIVDAKVYNLAGDPTSRPNYLRSLVTRNILSGTKDSMGETLSKGYLHGPGVKLRQFYKWASKPENYGTIGIPTADIAKNINIEPPMVEPHIPNPGGEYIVCTQVTVSEAIYIYWAEQWVMDNYPDRYTRNWKARISSDGSTITVTFPEFLGDPQEEIPFTPVNYDPTGTYIYAYYYRAGDQKLFIYKKGSGITALDDLTVVNDFSGGFYPYIPIRLNNNFLSSTYLEPAYIQSKNAYKRATKSSYDALRATLETNPNVNDMDYIYVVFGVPLNTKDQAGLKYLYTFFKDLADNQSGSAADYEAWKLRYNEDTDYREDYYAWLAAQEDPQNPLYQTAPPFVPNPPSAPENYIVIASNGAVGGVPTDFKVMLQWVSMDKGTGAGRRLGKPTGSVWFENNGSETFTEGGGENRSIDIEIVTLYYQKTDTEYEYIQIMGLQHINYIFAGNAVVTGMFSALQDSEDSRFIIPLHYDTLRETNMVAATQLATSCTYLMINSYEVKNIPWWQSGFFAVILVIVIAIAVTVFTGGAGAGLLGANLAIGTALGLTGMTAAIVGSVANALAALVLVTVIQKVATAVFGDLIGGIIAAVATIVIGMGASNNWTFSVDTVFNPENILKITNVIGEGYSNFLTTEIKEIETEIRDYTKWADEQADRIQEQYIKEFGGASLINPMMFTDMTKSLSESPSTFLQRTLLTGTDIAELSHELLSNFTEHSMKLPTAFT